MIILPDIKCVSNTIKPKDPPGANVLFESGIFNPAYVYDNFDPYNNEKIEYIDRTNSYTSGSIGRYYFSRKDYDLDYFDYPDGSLSNENIFSLKISNYNEPYNIQSGMSFENGVLKVKHYKRDGGYDSSRARACFSGLIIPIKNFLNFFNKTSYNQRGIYVRYRFTIVDDPTLIGQRTSHLYDGIEGAVGYQISNTKMESVIRTDYVENVFRTVEEHDKDNWNTCLICKTSIYDKHEYDENNNYFLKIGLATDIALAYNVYQDGEAAIEIDKIWSDDLSE